MLKKNKKLPVLLGSKKIGIINEISIKNGVAYATCTLDRDKISDDFLKSARKINCTVTGIARKNDETLFEMAVQSCSLSIKINKKL